MTLHATGKSNPLTLSSSPVVEPNAVPRVGITVTAVITRAGTLGTIARLFLQQFDSVLTKLPQVVTGGHCFGLGRHSRTHHLQLSR